MDIINKNNKDIIILKKIGCAFELSDDEDFKYFNKFNDKYYNIIERKKNIDSWTFITVPIDNIKKGKLKNFDFGYIIIFDDSIYYWDYNESQIAINYNFNTDTTKFKEASIFTKYLMFLG